jgi:hypothetical protein
MSFITVASTEAIVALVAGPQAPATTADAGPA